MRNEPGGVGKGWTTRTGPLPDRLYSQNSGRLLKNVMQRRTIIRFFFLSEQTSFLEQFCAKPLQSWPTLCDPWTVAHQGPLSLGLPRQEYWSGLPWPSPGHLPHPGIKPASHASVLASGFFTTSTTWEPNQTKVIKSNQNLTNQKVTFKVNGKRPQM